MLRLSPSGHDNDRPNSSDQEDQNMPITGLERLHLTPETTQAIAYTVHKSH